MSTSNDILWIIGEDFNMILNEEEKMGGLPFEQHEAMDFTFCINNCSLMEIKYSGSDYTWWNRRIEKECIFKRLDRVLVNNVFLDSYPSSEVVYLIKDRSGHAPIQLECKTED